MTVRAIRDLAAAVRGRRKELAMTQAALAQRAGLSRKWIYEFEAGKPAAELGLVLRVVDALGLELRLAAQGASAASSAADAVDLDAVLAEYQGDA